MRDCAHGREVKPLVHDVMEELRHSLLGACAVL